MKYTYTSSDENEIGRIEERLRAEGVRFQKVRTQPRTFRDEESGQDVTVGSARPWNITVSGKKNIGILEKIIGEKKAAA